MSAVLTPIEIEIRKIEDRIFRGAFLVSQTSYIIAALRYALGADSTTQSDYEDRIAGILKGADELPSDNTPP